MQLDLHTKPWTGVTCANHTTVSLDCSFRDGKPEPHATRIGASRFLSSKKGIENPLQVLVRNTRSVIPNREDLFDSKPSPRTESLIASALQWAERIMRKVDAQCGS